MYKRVIAGTVVWMSLMVIAGISSAVADVQMNEVVVTATKTERKSQDVTQSVTVITSDAIQKSGATDVAGVLATTAGATVTDQGPLGSLQSVNLRGSTYQQVLVLLDGKRLNSASAGGYDLSELPVPLDSIERIEIVRGPASALYGADAVGGVVNIITKKPEKPITTLSGVLGEHGYSSASLYNAGKGGNTYYSLSVGKEQYSGYRTNSHADQTTAGIKIGNDFDAASSIEASFDFVEKKIGVPGSVVFPSELARQQNREAVTGLKYKKRLTSTVDFSIRAYETEERLNYQDPNFSVFSKDRSTTDGGEAQLNWIMNSFSVVTLGAEGRNDIMVDSAAGTHRAALSSAFIQDEMSLGDLFILVLGGRNDKHSVYGSKWSPKASARYLNAGSGTIVRASYGKSFRAPTLNDLYFRDAYGDIGNPNLRPESAEEYEGGIEQPFGSGNAVKFTAFRRRVQDLIAWQTDPITFVSTPVNIGRARISGTETELRFVISEVVSGNFNYTLFFPVDENTHERLFSDSSHIPASQLGGTLSAALDQQTVLSLNGRWVKNYVRPGDPKWEYYTVDGKITDTVVSRKDLKAQVFIGVKNIFDRKYETVIVQGYPPEKGYPMPPREFYGGMSVTF